MSNWNIFSSTLFSFGKKEFFVFVAGIVGSECYKYYKSLKEYEVVKDQIFEIKFVKNTNKPCKTHIYNGYNCTEEMKFDSTFECSHSILRWMVNFFDSTNDTLDIAIYLVTCVEFKEAILRAFQRGVVVRIIADFTMAKGSGSAIPNFIDAGIPVRMHDSKHMMHRKSAISDGKIVLMGSGNWTMQALAGNWDGWIRTSDPDIVEGYIAGFEHQWADPVLIQPNLKEFIALKITK